MIKIIPKGTHKAWSIPWLIFGKTITKTVTFFPSARYEFGSNDQLDWNKLFGIGFFPGKHINSYRIGWRFNVNTGRVDLAAYWYQNGKRGFHSFASVGFMQPVECRIMYQSGYVEFKVSTGEAYTLPGSWQPFGWKLGLYFGGNMVAPHDIKIEIK